MMALTLGFLAAVIVLPYTYYDQFNLMYEKVTLKEISTLREFGLDTSIIRGRKNSTSSDINNSRRERSTSTSNNNNNNNNADIDDSSGDDLVDELSMPLDQASYCLLILIRLKIIDSTFLTYLLKRHREYVENTKNR